MYALICSTCDSLISLVQIHIFKKKSKNVCDNLIFLFFFYVPFHNMVISRQNSLMLKINENNPYANIPLTMDVIVGSENTFALKSELHENQEEAKKGEEKMTEKKAL